MPPPVTEADEYNYLSFQHDDAVLAGWCNSNTAAPDAPWRPETDEDAAFVAGVAHMHAMFADHGGADGVCELVVRPQNSGPIFGKQQFGTETFFQRRKAAPAPAPPVAAVKVRGGFSCVN